MARGDLDYKVTADTSQAQASLGKLKDSIGKTNTDFVRFRETIATIALGSFVRSAYQMADAISDVASASGLGTQFVLGFSGAVGQAGGNFEGAQVGIARLSASITNALQGNKEAIANFQRLGISLDDLANQTDRVVFEKTIQGLSRLGQNSASVGIAMDLLGKKFATVNFQQLNAGLGAAVTGAAETADAIDSAGAASDSFAKATLVLQTELLKVLKPISDAIVGFSEMGESFRNFVSIAIKIGIVVASFTLFGKAVSLARAAMVGMAAGATFLSEAAAGVVNLFRNFGGVLKNLAELPILGRFRVIGNLLKDFGAWAFASIPGVAALGTALAYIWDLGKGAIGKIKDLLGFGDDAAKQAQEAQKKAAEKAAADAAAIEAKKKMLEQQRAEAAKKAAEEQAKRDEKIRAGVLQELNAQAQRLASFRAANDEQLRGLQYQEKSATMSERQRAIADARNQLEARYIGQIQDLLQRQEELKRTIASVDQIRAQTGKEASQAEKDAAETAQKQLPLVAEAVAKVTEEYRRQIGVIEEAAAAAYDAAAAEQFRARVVEFSAEQESRARQQVREINDEIAKSTLPEPERKYYDIEAAAREAGIAEIESINSQRRAAKQALLTEEEKEKIMAASVKRSGELRDATRRAYENSRSFSTGWKRAMNEYIANATDGAKRAENIFRTATQGMEEAIVNFAKTGKFEWKNFVTMMLEELLRAQIQQVFAQLMGTMSNTMRQTTSGFGGGGSGGGGLGSILGSLGSIFGGGSSGNNNSNILGSLGNVIGSIFGGSPSTNPMIIGGGIGGGGIGSTIGNVLGNITGGIGSIVSGIGSGISSAIDSIGDFFGGFFANGGTLGAGRWGIAGENGPELISGPATVTPMGGATNVTYNINAVDAASFKQLVAQDPGFIHAVVMAGAKSMPSARR